MKHRSWIAITGFVWLLIGSFLLYKGLHLIYSGTLLSNSLCFYLSGFFGTPEQAGTILIALGLFIGFIKGRFVLSKTVHRVATRIGRLALPLRFSEIYAASYWILIFSMVALGMSLRFLPILIDVRGLIDVAVGSALLNGSMLYFRFAKAFHPTST